MHPFYCSAFWHLYTQGHQHPDEDQEHFITPVSLCCQHPIPTPGNPRSIFCHLRSVLSVSEFHVNGKIYYVHFCGWLLTLSVMFMRFICAVVGLRLFFFFFSIAKWYSIVWIHLHLFTYAPDGWVTLGTSVSPSVKWEESWLTWLDCCEV